VEYQKFIQNPNSEAAENPPRSPFSKGEFSFVDSNPSLEKRGRGDFGRLGKR
jgi:hypothetical protein